MLRSPELSEESDVEFEASDKYHRKMIRSNSIDENSPLIKVVNDEPRQRANRGSISIRKESLPETIHDVLQIPVKGPKPGEVYLKPYWKILLITALFYAVPSIQFVIIQYNERSNDADGDGGDGVYCYYNYKCANQFLGIAAFNNVISNFMYLFAGIAFLLLVRVQEQESFEDPLYGTGLHNDMSLYYCLGWCLVLEAIFSALYHVCPSRLNFQFDTLFMIIGASLLFITLYQKRQPTLVSGPFRIFGYLALIVLLCSFSLVPVSFKLFWLIVIIIFTYVSLTGSIHLYYYEKLELDRTIFRRALYQITHIGLPRDLFRFMMIVVTNIANYTLIIMAVTQGIESDATKDFPSFLLGLLVLDLLIYMVYYTIMKYRSGEKVYPRVWIVFVLVFGFCSSALYFYNLAVTNKFLTPAQSAALNKPCVLFGFFDYHDVWHFLSAWGVVLLYLGVYWLDMDIQDRPRTEIKVF